MVKIIADTVEELAKAQRYVIDGMTSEGKAYFHGTFELSSGNRVIVKEGYWKRIIGERLPDGSVRYVNGYFQNETGRK